MSIKKAVFLQIISYFEFRVQMKIKMKLRKKLYAFLTLFFDNKDIYFSDLFIVSIQG